MTNLVIDRIFGRRKRTTAETATVPEHLRVYAIGDIHGRADLLHRLHTMIREDSAAMPPAHRKALVYLGDYVDRGHQSREVIDYLLDHSLAGFDAVHLKGNHDQYFLDFLRDPQGTASWLNFGGDATIYSYGVRVPDDLPADRRLSHIRRQLLERVPQRHLEFLNRLNLAWVIGDYLFVHAGVHPERSLAKQTSKDVLWIRDEFLNSKTDFGKIVIHGHTMTDQPEMRHNRIGIDTGACYSNRLTCLVLEGASKRFLCT